MILRDVHSDRNLDRAKIDEIECVELRYVDGTVVFFWTVNTMNSFFRVVLATDRDQRGDRKQRVRKCTAHYDIHLNKDKCVSSNYHATEE